MKTLLSEYRQKRKDIKNRLKEFKNIHKGENKDIFAELCFCLLTPQSKAVSCDKAIAGLKKSGLLYTGCVRAISKNLKGVRFHNNKSAYIVGARNLLGNKKGIDIKAKLDPSDAQATRDWLVKNIKGLGYKEASHFLRNIGLGKDLAIIDRHILRNLKKYKVISKTPASLSRKVYLDIENKMRGFSRRINIPLDELDFLFWSKETGMIFK